MARYTARRCGARQRPVRTTSRSLRLAVLLTFVGGFLDAYTYVSRGGVFAGAQTGNVVLLAVAVTGHRAGNASTYLVSIGAFLLGTIGAASLKLPGIARRVRYPDRVALAFEAVVLAVVGFLPAAVPDRVVTAILASMAGLQLTSIRTLGADRWSYNTTMTTGNLRTLGQAAVQAVFQRDPAARAKALSFGAIITSFALGAATGGLATVHLHDRAIWIAAAVLASSVVLFLLDE